MLESVSGTFTRANGTIAEGELSLHYDAPNVGRLRFRSRGKVFGVDELRKGHLTFRVDPRPIEVRGLLEEAKGLGITVMVVDPDTRRLAML